VLTVEARNSSYSNLCVNVRLTKVVAMRATIKFVTKYRRTKEGKNYAMDYGNCDPNVTYQDNELYRL
jgi:hypothetical protein